VMTWPSPPALVQRVGALFGEGGRTGMVEWVGRRCHAIASGL
jgi:hypothetical protein